MPSLLYAFTLSLVGAGFAEAQTCLLQDASGTPVSYANVYVPALQTGIVSSATGEVRLSPKLATAPPTTPTTVSCIGYEDSETTLGALQTESEVCALRLKAVAYPLAVAEVRVPRRGQRVTYGFRKDKTRAVGQFYESDGAGDRIVSGAEVGNVMTVSGPWALTSVGFNVEVDTATLFEVNVYGFADGRPTERLHRERIFLEVAACIDEIHRETLDVTAFGIEGKGAFVVCLEVLGAIAPLAAPLAHADNLPGDDHAVECSAGGDSNAGTSFPRFNFKIALRKKDRLTRYRDRSGEWRKTPLGVVAGIWCEVEQ